MMRAAVFFGILSVFPAVAFAQRPCTTDARVVVNEIYRHMLERAPDRGSAAWVDQLTSGGSTVREVVRAVAKSPEHLQRFGNEGTAQGIATLYDHILGRQPDPTGQREFANLARSQGLSAVVDGIVESREYQQSFGDWGVPGSSGVRYCGTGAIGEQNSSQRIEGMRYRRMDTNRDGVISRNEWRGSGSFDELDWNNDGVLSGDEVRIGSVPPPTRARARDDYYGEDADRFDYLDVNGNGMIERGEWDGGFAAFTRLDTDRNGSLSIRELAAGNNSSPGGFDSVDQNRDGRLTLNEWPWSHRAFDDQDANGDGVLTRSEFRGGPTGTSGR